MNVKLAAAKLPALAPGEFRFITKSLAIEPSGDGGKRRFKTIASSTVKDMGGDEVKMSALEDMAGAFRRGLNIFVDHKHDAENVFGRSDQAEIRNSGVSDDKGNPIWDLHIAGVVNEPNPRMVQLADSIDGGYVTLGTSIGAIVKEHQRNKSGGMDIYHVDLKEGSIVGIPMNQRSWTYKAAKAAEALDESTEIDDDDEPEVSKADTIDPETGTIAGTPEKAPDESEAGKANDEAAHNPTTPTTDAGEKPAEAPTAGTDEAADAGVQESDQETPETTPVIDPSQTDPPTAEKAAGEVTDEVRELLGHVRKLVETIGTQSEEIATLNAKVASYDAKSSALTSEIDLAKEAIEKVMELPLRAKTAGYIQNFTKTHSLFDPEIEDFLNKKGIQ